MQPRGRMGPWQSGKSTITFFNRRRKQEHIEYMIRNQNMGVICGFGRYSDVHLTINSDGKFWCIDCRDTGAGKTKNGHVCIGDNVAGAWVHLKMHARLDHKIPKKVWNAFKKIVDETDDK